MTVTGTDATAGTESTGGGYVAQTVTFPAASGTTSAASTNAQTFLNMPASTVVGIEIWDSAGTPVRLWWGPLTASKTFAGGETFTLAIGGVTLAQD